MSQDKDGRDSDEGVWERSRVRNRLVRPPHAQGLGIERFGGRVTLERKLKCSTPAEPCRSIIIMISPSAGGQLLTGEMCCRRYCQDGSFDHGCIFEYHKVVAGVQRSVADSEAR